MTERTHAVEAALDAKQLQRRMMLYYTQDGLWDLFVGACVLAWGLLIDTSMSAMILIACAAAFALLWAAKRTITHPRVGYARFRRASKPRRLLAAFIGMIVGGGLVLLTSSEVGSRFIQPYLPVWTALAIGFLVALVAWSFGAKRFYAYGTLIFLAGVVHQWGGISLGLSVTVAGLAIALSGVNVLMRFLRENPKVDESANV